VRGGTNLKDGTGQSRIPGPDQTTGGFGFSRTVWQDGVPLVPKQQRARLLNLIDPVAEGPDDDDR